MFGLAADGKTSKMGMSNPLRLAVIAKHHFADVRLPVIPHLLQRAALAAGAPAGQGLIARSTRRRERPLSPRKETLRRTANVAGP
jgi:hypothetical protein